MKRFLFPGIQYWLLLLIPLTGWAFYNSYFSRFFESPPVFHIHAFFMMLWIGVAILQPVLIYKKKTLLHKTVGKISYALMPLVVLSTWWMLHQSYFFYFNREMNALSHLPEGEALQMAALNAGHELRIGILYLFSLIVFYTAAVVYRKQTAYHATLMFAAVLTLLGPTVDRIIYPLAKKYFPDYIDVNIAFIMIDLLLIGLLVYQQKKQVHTGATVFSLVFYLTWQVVFYTLPPLAVWHLFVHPFG